MQHYYIRSVEHAKAIVAAWERCGSCDRCPLSTPEGWKCGYLHDCALEYLRRHGDGPKPSETPSAR